LTVGLLPRSAQALAAAGYHALADLRPVTREELLTIPGVGPASLAVLEDALGRPIPSQRKRRSTPPPTHPWPETVWRRRGLSPWAASTFAREGMTLERLGSLAREDLLGWVGVGPGTLRACELILGRSIPSRKVGPVETFWRTQGIPLQQARALSRAGIASLDGLRNLSREEILALRGVRDVTLERLEGILGSAIPSRTEEWIRLGLPQGYAKALVRERIYTLADLAALSREQFLSFRSLGRAALWRCEKLLGRKLPSTTSRS
jgi:hypothetical protein